VTRRLIRLSCLTVVVPGLLVAACAPLSGPQPPSAEERAASRRAQGDHEHAARLYLQAAENASAESRNELRLEAAEAALRADALGLARKAIAPIDSESLGNDRRNRLELVRVQLRIADMRPGKAIELVPPPPADTPPETAARIWGLRAELFFDSGRLVDGVHALVQRDVWLMTPDAARTNDERIWQTLKGAPLGEIDTGTLRGEDRITRGWIELARIADRMWVSRHRLEQQIGQWRQRYPGHPAMRHILPRRFDYTVSRDKAAERPSGGSLGLALPLTGSYANAAKAIQKGFLMAYYAEGDGQRPAVHVYDTNAAMGMGKVLEDAETDAVQILVGPLAKHRLEALAKPPRPEMAVLALNYIENTPADGLPFYQFGLSPEDEARAAAEYAARKSWGRAVALVPHGDWGNRVLEAFRDELEYVGGRLLSAARFEPSKKDHATPIRALTDYWQAPEDMDSSEHEPDIDFIFIAAQPAQARLLRSQLRFFRASRIPVLATSHAYAGREDPERDVDLDGLIFADMPWLLDTGDGTIASRHRRAGALWPEIMANQPRLFALGYDAYLLYQRLRDGRPQPGTLLTGNTGELYLESDGQIRRHLEWAQFVDGKPVPRQPQGSLDVDTDAAQP